ncbi:MAG: SCO family protein [Gammaproteobacteria bacterium]
MIRTFAGRIALICLAAVLVTACGGSQQWKTSNITGVMPDLQFTLTRDNGKTVHASGWRGKITLLYFGYTHCPDVCPLTLATIAQALKKMGPEAKQVRVLFVSVDPKRDTLPVLKTYTQAFSPQIVGLTGTQTQLQALSRRYRVSYSYDQPNADGSYAVNHSSAIFVFDGKGKVRLLMNYTDGADAMAHDLRQLVAES